MGAALATTSGSASPAAASGPSASAVPAGLYYAAGIFTKTNQNLSIGSLTNVKWQSDEAAVAQTMSPDELKLATAALGGTPTAGFEVTKTFDDGDKAAAIAALAETTLSSAGLWTYNNGTLCDHMRSAPVYVASVAQTPPPAGSTADITETIQFVATQFTRVVPTATCPTATPPTGTGTKYTASFTYNGKSYNWPDVKIFAFRADESAISRVSSTNDITVFKQKFLANPKYLYTLTKSYDDSDNKLDMSRFRLKPVTVDLVLTITKPGVKTAKYTIHDIFITKWEFSAGQGLKAVDKLTFFGSKPTQTYS
jgi:hypothetical protein